MRNAEAVALEEAVLPEAPARTSATPLSRAEWVILLAIGAVQFMHILDFMIVMPLGPEFIKRLDLTAQQFGFIVSAYAFSASVAGLCAAAFLDRFDRKRALLGLFAGFILGTLLCAVAPGYYSLLVARIVAGAFGGVVAATILAIVGDVFPEVQRGRAMGVVMSAFSLASIAGVPAGLYLANHFGWRSPFAVLGGVSIGVWFLVRAVLPPVRTHLEHPTPSAGRATTWQVLTEADHVRAYLLMTALVFSSFMVVPYIATYFVTNAGRTVDEMPYVYLFGGVATLLTMTPVGKLADRFGKLGVFRGFALLAIVPTLWLTNLPAVSLWLSLLVTTFYMVATSARMVPAMALITSCVVPRYRGSFLSINASVQQMAAGLASAAGGTLLGKTEAGTLTGFALVGLLAALAMLISIFLAGRLRPVEGGDAVPVPFE